MYTDTDMMYTIPSTALAMGVSEPSLRIMFSEGWDVAYPLNADRTYRVLRDLEYNTVPSDNSIE